MFESQNSKIHISKGWLSGVYVTDTLNINQTNVHVWLASSCKTHSNRHTVTDPCNSNRGRNSESPRAGWFRSRNLIGAKFSAPVQTGPGAHPASYIPFTGSFPAASRPGSGVDHLPHLAPRLKKVHIYISTPPVVPSRHIIECTLPLILKTRITFCNTRTIVNIKWIESYDLLKSPGCADPEAKQCYTIYVRFFISFLSVGHVVLF
jgi:hypothetical protein